MTLLLVTACLWMGACSSSSREGRPKDERTPVRVRKADRIRQPQQIAVSGSIEPRETVDLAFQVAGKVVRVFPEEGVEVRSGQLLAEIDPTDYRFGLDAASAQAGMARANLDKANAGARAQELERARVAFARAEDEYGRMKKLFDRKSLAPNDFEKFEAGYLAAKAQYEEAKEGARKEDKSAARSAYEQAQAGEKVARKRLSDTRLMAPIGGVVARRGVDPGETVAAGYPVFSIADLSVVKVRVGVPESDIGLVRIGQHASVEIPALPGQFFEGHVELVGAVADPASRTYSVKIAVPNPKRLLRAGMIAEARIQGNVMVDTITLPGEAVVRDPQGATLVYVYLDEKKRVYGRRVELGTVLGREVEIKSGLTGGELVVVAGQQQVRDGMPVVATEASR
ncbi:MAG: efflux RND transporter periplasmic adaptor subunit [Bryobacteraceae bacterium]